MCINTANKINWEQTRCTCSVFPSPGWKTLKVDVESRGVDGKPRDDCVPRADLGSVSSAAFVSPGSAPPCPEPRSARLKWQRAQQALSFPLTHVCRPTDPCSDSYGCGHYQKSRLLQMGWKRFYPLKGWRSLSSRTALGSGRRLECVLTMAAPLEAGPSVD